MPQPAPLRLIAGTESELVVIAAAVQDAVVKTVDIRYLRRDRRFSLEINRFHWETGGKRGPWFRSRSILAVDNVGSVRSRGVNASASGGVLLLLTASFAPTPSETGDPAGVLRLVFADGAEIEIDVECIDVTLYDTDRIWPARRRPDHSRDAT